MKRIRNTPSYIKEFLKDGIDESVTPPWFPRATPVAGTTDSCGIMKFEAANHSATHP